MAPRRVPIENERERDEAEELVRALERAADGAAGWMVEGCRLDAVIHTLNVAIDRYDRAHDTMGDS